MQDSPSGFVSTYFMHQQNYKFLFIFSGFFGLVQLPRKPTSLNKSDWHSQLVNCEDLWSSMYDVSHSITHEVPVEQDCYLEKNYMAHVHWFAVVIINDNDGKHKQTNNSLDFQALLSTATCGLWMMQMLCIEHGALWNEFVVSTCQILDLAGQACDFLACAAFTGLHKLLQVPTRKLWFYWWSVYYYYLLPDMQPHLSLGSFPQGW